MPVEYREETPAGWSDRVAATWTISERDTAVVLAGECPKCAHPCVITIDSVEGVAGQPGAGSKGRGPEHLVVVCGCRLAHPGAPDGVLGCGRGGYLLLSFDES